MVRLSIAYRPPAITMFCWVSSRHGAIPPPTGVFNDQGVSDLGRLVYHVTLPSLLFVNILRQVRRRSLRQVAHPLALLLLIGLIFAFAFASLRLVFR